MKDLEYYMSLHYPYEIAPDEEGATVVFHPDLPGCYSFSEIGLESALEGLAVVRRLWMEGRLQAMVNIPEPTERGNTS